MLKPGDVQPQEKVTYTFVPQEQIEFILPGFNPICSQSLSSGNLYVSYTHYSPGFYERIALEPFNIFETTQRFGALYYDTLAIPLDTSP